MSRPASKKLLVSGLLFFFCLFSFQAVLPGQSAMAQAQPAPRVAEECNKSGLFLGIPPWYKYLRVKYDAQTKSCDITGPRTENQDGEMVFDWQKASGRIALAAVEILLRVAAYVSVGFVIYGGISYIISQGDPDRVRGAKGSIINALIGLVIAMLAVAVVNLIGNNLV